MIFAMVFSNRRLHACSLVCHSWKRVLSSAVFWKKMASKQEQMYIRLDRDRTSKGIIENKIWRNGGYTHILLTLSIDEFQYPWMIPITKTFDERMPCFKVDKPSSWQEWSELLHEECDEGDPSDWRDYVRKEIHERLDLSDRKLVKLELLDRNENLYEFIHYDGGCDLIYEDGCFKFMFDGVLRSKNDADLIISFRTLIDHIEITISDDIDSNCCESPRQNNLGQYCRTQYPCTSWLEACDELILSHNKLTYFTSDSLAIRNPKSN